ncbi:hypothetical protein EBZ80_09640 [bacterium]|nr:hypothetical protein [bacterium]
MIERLLPLALMGSMGYKGYEKKEVVTGKVQEFVHSVERVVNYQRMSTVAHALELAMIDEHPPRIDDQRVFKETVQRLVGIGRKGKGDASKDFWGTELRIQVKGNLFAIFSAGPDMKWGTSDDQRVVAEIAR